MRIVKKINNNVAYAQDDTGCDLIVFGRGIGFHEMPYEITDMTEIQKIFYHFDERLIPMLASISAEALSAASQIVDLARDDLNCVLNPNLAITLADHLQFALKRALDGTNFENPLMDNVEAVYPHEALIGQRALTIVKTCCGITLPASEACAIALHIINAESDANGTSTLNLVLKSTSIIEDIISLIEDTLHTVIDRNTYNYLRLTIHLRFLINRFLEQETATKSRPDSGKNYEHIVATLAHEYPKAAECAQRISDFLKSRHGWTCTKEEELYLMLHTNQFIEKSED